MISIITNENHEIAEAPSLEAAITALRTLVPEEREDLRAVAEDGTVLAWGAYRGSRRKPGVWTTQGIRQRHQPGVRGNLYSADWLND